MAEYEKLCEDIGLLSTYVSDGYTKAVLRRAEKAIRELSAADVVPVRHGRWVETTQPMGWEDVTCAECSECGEDFLLDEWGMEDMKNLMLYCPNCGAQMTNEEETE